jgi:hypothetical protein
MTWRRPVAAAKAGQLYRLGLTMGEADVHGQTDPCIRARRVVSRRVSGHQHQPGGPEAERPD